MKNIIIIALTVTVLLNFTGCVTKTPIKNDGKVVCKAVCIK